VVVFLVEARTILSLGNSDTWLRLVSVLRKQFLYRLYRSYYAIDNIVVLSLFINVIDHNVCSHVAL